MNQGDKQIFYSKIMFFGEYSLMYGSMALSIPFPEFSGSFVKKSELDTEEKKSNYYLNEFAGYLENTSSKGHDKFKIDLDRFVVDIDDGLVFKSNIPQGYGLGSSGALVAAVYAAYGNNENIDQENMSELLSFKDFLAQMESYFHGKSSGLDPLICFLKKSILIEGKKKLSIPDLPNWPDEAPGGAFLINSGLPGETQPLVDLFIERCCDENYFKLIKTIYIPLVNSCIKAYAEGKSDVLNENLKLLSAFQLEHFKEMIPVSMQSIWKEGLESGNFSLKLCGSGGGGMMLGFTADFERASQILNNQKITSIHPL